MSPDEDRPEPTPPPTGPKSEQTAAREARLAQALRANLRRRKAAGRADGGDGPKG